MTPFTVTEADFQDNFLLVDKTGASPNMVENKYNCATPDAAARFLTHLNTLSGEGLRPLHPTPSTDFPQSGWTGDGPFTQQGPGEGKVPYLDFVITDDAGNVTTMHENVGGILTEYLFGNSRLADWNCCNNWYKGAA